MNARAIGATRQSRDREAHGTLSASAQFVPLPAEAGCETCQRIVVILFRTGLNERETAGNVIARPPKRLAQLRSVSHARVSTLQTHQKCQNCYDLAAYTSETIGGDHLRRSGSVLSRFDRFLLIGPRAKGGPALCVLTNKFALYIEADCVQCRRGAQCFSRCFERPKRFLNYSNGLSEYSINSLYHHLQNTQPYLQSFRYSDKAFAVSQNVFAVSKVKVKEALTRATTFCKRGIYSKKIQVNCTGALNSLVRMVIVFSMFRLVFFPYHLVKARQRWLSFVAVFCFIHERVSYLADQVSIVATKYGSIVDASTVTTTCLLKVKFTFSS